jgi:sugar O-acyltransferase (sialic acid O-acetyltransferase NeuD family)
LKRRICIYGAGFQGRIVFDIVSCYKDLEVVCFRDDSPSCAEMYGIPVVADDSPYAVDATVLAIGNDNFAKIRFKQAVIQRIKSPLQNAVDQSATVSIHAELGQNIICHPHTVIMTGSKIGNFTIISTGATIDHDNTLEEFVNVCPGVHTAGNVYLGRGAFLGTGAIILPRIKIGRFAMVGAGAVVTKDVPDYATVVGVPAKIIKIGDPNEYGD